MDWREGSQITETAIACYQEYGDCPRVEQNAYELDLTSFTIAMPLCPALYIYRGNIAVWGRFSFGERRQILVFNMEAVGFQFKTRQATPGHDADRWSQSQGFVDARLDG